MRYNQFDFDYALESMDSVDLSAQANRLADYGDDEFAGAVLEAYEDMYAALEAGDLEEALDIYAALEEAEEVVEEDPNVARKAKRKALLKKVGAGAGVLATAALAKGAHNVYKAEGVLNKDAVTNFRAHKKLVKTANKQGYKVTGGGFSDSTSNQRKLKNKTAAQMHDAGMAMGAAQQSFRDQEARRAANIAARAK